METIDLFQRFSVALAIGMLIGLERGWQERGEREGERTAGLRTYTLSALLGAVWAALAVGRGEAGILAISLAFSVYALIFAAMRYREMRHDQTYGITSIVAAMLAFALGAYAVAGDMQLAAAAGVVTMALLSLKSTLHGFIQRITWTELRSGLLLLAMTFILLPLLPNRTIDPWGLINPFETWLLTIMIAAISFAGYVAIKAFGSHHGIVFSGIAGGLASSTAVTVTMAQMARQHPEQRPALVAGALLAGATMVARILAVVGVINWAVFLKLSIPFALAGTTLLGIAAYLLYRQIEDKGEAGELSLKNPFDLAVVLKFGALLLVVTAAANLVTTFAGSSGAYILAAASSVADVDAISLSMARLASGPLGETVAATAIAIAAAGNTLSKSALGWMTGGAEFGWRMFAAAAAAIVAGGAGLLLAPIIV